MNQKGMTLIEMMVAIAIAVFVVASGFTFFNNTFNFSLLHRRSIDMQKETRVAMDILSREIRNAGFGVIDPMMGTFQGTAAMIQPGNNSDPDPMGTPGRLDRITLVGAYNGVGVLGAAAGNGAAQITISFLAGMNPADLVGKTVTIEGFYYGTVTSRVGATNVFNISPSLPRAYTARNMVANGVATIQRIRYRVAIPAGETEPALLREVDFNNDGAFDTTVADSVIASGIEDLQFAYLLTDGTEVNNPPALVFPPTGVQISAVRVSLLARALDPKTTALPSTRPTLEDHAGAAAADRYHRRLITKVVEVRNLGLFN